MLLRNKALDMRSQTLLMSPRKMLLRLPRTSSLSQCIKKYLPMRLFNLQVTMIITKSLQHPKLMLSNLNLISTSHQHLFHMTRKLLMNPQCNIKNQVMT